MEKNKSALELLSDYNKNSVTHKLRDKFLTPSFFDIIQKDRSETVHSNFLKWIFELQCSNGITGFNIISALLRAVWERAEIEAKKSLLPIDLAKAVYGDSTALRINDKSNIIREYPCPGVTCNGSSGFVDIVISGFFSADKKTKPFKIIIENKVDSKEHDLQTWKYYTYFEGKCIEGETPKGVNISKKQYESPDEEVRIYVFLTPDFDPSKSECKCPYYIKINYQDIMDHCILPLLQSSQLDARTRLFLEEYARALSIPYINNNKSGIMCLTKDDIELLKEFWEANQTLIEMSIAALAQTSPEDEDVLKVQKALEVMSRSRKKYTITHKSGNVCETNQSRLMYDLMDMYNKYSGKSGAEIVEKYQEKLKSAFTTSDDKTTGYTEPFKFKDGTEKRVTTQKQRTKLDEIMKLAKADGFEIIPR